MCLEESTPRIAFGPWMWRTQIKPKSQPSQADSKSCQFQWHLVKSDLQAHLEKKKSKSVLLETIEVVWKVALLPSCLCWNNTIPSRKISMTFSSLSCNANHRKVSILPLSRAPIIILYSSGMTSWSNHQVLSSPIPHFQTCLSPSNKFTSGCPKDHFLKCSSW